jgi:hypothetical protein
VKLTPSRPITIHAARHAQRWFPALYHHTDGSLLMYIEFGYDAHFAPIGKWRSFDEGKTWREEEENVPRGQIAHVFADGSLFELDAYGFLDPNTPDTYHFYGAWSTPDAKGTTGHSAFYHGAQNVGEDWLGIEVGGVLRDTFTIHAPSIAPTSLLYFQQHGAYPHFPWWPLINRLYSPEVNGADVMLGVNITDTQELGGQLLAIGYGRHKDAGTHGHTSVFCYASDDKGRSWREIGLVTRGTPSTPEGFNEATLTALDDGRLYSVIRSGDALHHAWSHDGGRTWSTPAMLRLVDSNLQPRMVWPRVAQLEDGTLVLAWGRPGKHLAFDPTGTGDAWQGHLDLHALELSTQAENGVPENQRLRGDTENCVRYWDSGDYLSVVAVGPREVLVTYDVQNYIERPGSTPVAGVRMVRAQLED